jgi:hypothetical protein
MDYRPSGERDGRCKDSAHSLAALTAQKKQTNNRKCNADNSLPRRCFVEKKDACESHDGRAARKDCRNDGERTTFWKRRKKAIVPAPTQTPVSRE